MKKRGRIKPQQYKYELQAANLRAKFPQFGVTKKPYGYDFIGILKPRENEYLVKIEYRKHNHPAVFVLNPEISAKKHRYNDGSLCIYKQSEFHWREDRLVCKYIVPLTAMWLHYYELFLTHGIWLGPEAPHDENHSKVKMQEIP